MPSDVAATAPLRSWTAFPNPFTDCFFIEPSRVVTGPVAVTLYDMAGRQVYGGKSQIGSRVRIPRNGLDNGLYLYEIEATGQRPVYGRVLAR